MQIMIEQLQIFNWCQFVDLHKYMKDVSLQYYLAWC